MTRKNVVSENRQLSFHYLLSQIIVNFSESNLLLAIKDAHSFPNYLTSFSFPYAKIDALSLRCAVNMTQYRRWHLNLHRESKM